jgi:hypothetical protein
MPLESGIRSLPCRALSLTAGAEAVLLLGDVEEILQLGCFKGGEVLHQKTVKRKTIFYVSQSSNQLEPKILTSN